jgi:alpha-D-ribose 1-methylphosphonate 5-triphosphate synthase subunit PhnH
MHNAPSLDTPKPASIWHPALQQSLFRRLMDAFAYPGRILPLPALNAGETLVAVLATLVDGSVSLADPAGLLVDEEWSRLEAQRAVPEAARFVAARGEASADFTPALGSLENPHMGATLLLQVTALGEGQPLRLTGPGVDGKTLLRVSGLNPAWLERRREWNAGFPMGVDLLLLAPNHVAALPRSCQINLQGDA